MKKKGLLNYIGVDIGKLNCVVCIMDSNRSVIKEAGRLIGETGHGCPIDYVDTTNVKREIKNLSNDTLPFVKITGQFIDSTNLLTGVTSCCYAHPFDIEPGHTSTFDGFAQKDEMSGKPTSFSLSFLGLAIIYQTCQTRVNRHG